LTTFLWRSRGGFTKCWRKQSAKHNAELVVGILTDWLRKNGCNVTRDQVLRYLTAREAWV